MLEIAKTPENQENILQVINLLKDVKKILFIE